MKERGQGRPEFGNKQKTSDKLTPITTGEKKIESIRLLARELSDEIKLNITPEDIDSIIRPPKVRPSGVFDCSTVPPTMFLHKNIQRMVEDGFFSKEEAERVKQLPDGVFTMGEVWRLVQWLGELNPSRDIEK